MKSTKRTELPLPDLYLIDARKLLREVSRIHNLAANIPPHELCHSATVTVIDALFHLRVDMEEILKVEASIKRRWTERAEELAKENEPPRIGLKVVS